MIWHRLQFTHSKVWFADKTDMFFVLMIFFMQHNDREAVQYRKLAKTPHALIYLFIISCLSVRSTVLRVILFSVYCNIYFDIIHGSHERIILLLNYLFSHSLNVPFAGLVTEGVLLLC